MSVHVMTWNKYSGISATLHTLHTPYILSTDSQKCTHFGSSSIFRYDFRRKVSIKCWFCKFWWSFLFLHITDGKDRFIYKFQIKLSRKGYVTLMRCLYSYWRMRQRIKWHCSKNANNWCCPSIRILINLSQQKVKLWAICQFNH